jgi:hypothetical protein
MMARRNLYYVGLEPYEERYTAQMMEWFLDHFQSWCDNHNDDDTIGLVIVPGNQTANVVNTGVVLDAHGRCIWALTQMANLIGLMQQHRVSKNDVIFFEDFWHPGNEALPYIFDQTGVWPKVYARCHAQSVDYHDFTFPMRRWMRYYERGECVWLEKIFVASEQHIDMLVGADMGKRDKFMNVGLPFGSREVLKRVPVDNTRKKKKVVFTSRWDDEKQPWFFLQVAATVRRELGRNDITFMATTSRSSESAGYQRMARDCLGTSAYVKLCRKNDYYEALREAKVQFNCALQDFVSYGLIESSVYNCHPVYPRFLSFPECFPIEDQHYVFYQPFNVWQAADQVVAAIDRPIDEYDFSYIAAHHDKTYWRIFDEMLR